ncbi:hypothetical protein ML5_2279 [Micromonospora sp. L5]|uniref:hypothetical protein n=1 Tax=Micromonospora sp. (strain L5) TaxID=648999 RepID=UPI0001C44F63|nr:hypothetical protein [Micromonospora sp. L5]ADU07801.1 hypothetical protein ML5_2279 [Micromonospora sp. L5]
MSGGELDRINRNDEIIRLRVEEGLSTRKIGQIFDMSHVQVLNIIKNHRLAGPSIEATISERRESLAESLEDLVRVTRNRYLETLAPSDMQAHAKAVQLYVNLLGLNAQPSVSVEVSHDYSTEWNEAFKKRRTIDGSYFESS